MKKTYLYAVAVATVLVVVLLLAVFLPPVMPESQENATLLPTVQPTPRNDTIYLDIHPAGGQSVLLYPEDERYPAIDAECRELVQGIDAQVKTGFSPDELSAMKRNNTYVALRFPQPTTFETSYIVEGSPLNITIDEALIFMDREYEDTIITPSPTGTGVWRTSRDSGTLRDLVAHVLAEGKNES